MLDAGDVSSVEHGTSFQILLLMGGGSNRVLESWMRTDRGKDFHMTDMWSSIKSVPVVHGLEISTHMNTGGSDDKLDNATELRHICYCHPAPISLWKVHMQALSYYLEGNDLMKLYDQED